MSGATDRAWHDYQMAVMTSRVDLFCAAVRALAQADHDQPLSPAVVQALRNAVASYDAAEAKLSNVRDAYREAA